MGVGRDAVRGSALWRARFVCGVARCGGVDGADRRGRRRGAFGGRSTLWGRWAEVHADNAPPVLQWRGPVPGRACSRAHQHAQRVQRYRPRAQHPGKAPRLAHPESSHFDSLYALQQISGRAGSAGRASEATLCVHAVFTAQATPAFCPGWRWRCGRVACPAGRQGRGSYTKLTHVRNVSEAVRWPCCGLPLASSMLTVALPFLSGPPSIRLADALAVPRPTRQAPIHALEAVARAPEGVYALHPAARNRPSRPAPPPADAGHDPRPDPRPPAPRDAPAVSFRSGVRGSDRSRSPCP